MHLDGAARPESRQPFSGQRSPFVVVHLMIIHLCLGARDEPQGRVFQGNLTAPRRHVDDEHVIGPQLPMEIFLNRPFAGLESRLAFVKSEMR